jgi:hypothetical protein
MKTETTTTGAAAQRQYKGSNNNRKKQILSLLYAERLITAKGANDYCGFNDTRKIISVLRREGYKIYDRRLPNGCKQYYLAQPDGKSPEREKKTNVSQLNLFDYGGI